MPGQEIIEPPSDFRKYPQEVNDYANKIEGLAARLSQAKEERELRLLDRMRKLEEGCEKALTVLQNLVSYHEFYKSNNFGEPFPGNEFYQTAAMKIVANAQNVINYIKNEFARREGE